MNKILFISFIVAVLSCGCQKNNGKGIKDEEIMVSTGVIIGQDLNKCACCWGWKIKIDNAVYKFDRIPANSLLDLNTITFPTTVTIQWRNAQGSCRGRLIDVISISG